MSADTLRLCPDTQAGPHSFTIAFALPPPLLFIRLFRSAFVWIKEAQRPRCRRGGRKERGAARAFNELEETCLRRELSLGAIVSLFLVPMSVCPSFALAPVVRLSAAMPVSMSVFLSPPSRVLFPFLQPNSFRNPIYHGDSHFRSNDRFDPLVAKWRVRVVSAII